MRMLLCLTTLMLLVSVRIETGILAQDAVQEENKRLAAKNAYEEGQRLHTQGKAESLRKAIAKYEDALSLWRVVGDRSEEAQTLDTLGAAHHLLSDKQNMEKAIDCFKQALTLWRAVGDRRGESRSLNNLGAAY